MRSIIQVLIALAVSELVLSFSRWSASYDHAVYLDEDEKFQLLWSVDYPRKVVSFGVVVNTTGWVGLGIAKGQAGTMKNADFAVGFVDSNGKGHLVDRFATGNELPRRDDQQDLIFIGAEEKNGQTTLRFNRSIETCDMQDNKIQKGTTRLLFAYHDTDPDPTDDSTLKYHGSKHRGSRSVNLIGYSKPAGHVSTDTHVDLINNGLVVPKSATTYWCSVKKFKRSDFGGKRHIVEMAPIITPGNEGIVHHVVVYICSSVNDSHLSHSSECDSPIMPPVVSKCRGEQLLSAWAIGGETFVMPDHVGMPVGEHDELYLLMIMHYDNPEMKEGVIDSSGMRYYYTDKLRKYDTMIVYSGRAVYGDLLIPPRQKEWVETVYCTPSCSKNFSESSLGDLKVYAALPHMHLAGRALVSTLVRNGKEIQEIIRDDNYDFNYQQIHLFPKEIIIKPGDTIKTRCTFNTESTSEVTLGGEATNEEMCIVYMLYYPKISVTRCSSRYFDVYEEFSKKYAPVATSSPMRKSYNWTGVPWTQDKTDELKKMKEDATRISTLCGSAMPSGDRTVVNGREDEPTIDVPLPVIDECKSIGSGASTLLPAIATGVVCLVLTQTSLIVSLFLV